MKIKTLTLENFMIFDSIDVEWSPNINVILGENSTGKTTLLKAMYSLVKPYGRSDFLKCTQMQQEDMIVGKMVGVFRPDEKKIGRMSSRRRGAPKNTKGLYRRGGYHRGFFWEPQRKPCGCLSAAFRKK